MINDKERRPQEKMLKNSPFFRLPVFLTTFLLCFFQGIQEGVFLQGLEKEF